MPAKFGIQVDFDLPIYQKWHQT